MLKTLIEGQVDQCDEQGNLAVPPASEVALERLRDRAPVRLPRSYLEQLAASTGGEGDLGVKPVMLPFIPLEAGEALQIARSFQELRDFIGRSFQETT